MTVNNRLLPTMVLMLLVLLPLASILVIVHAKEVATLEYDASSLRSARLDGRQQVQSSDSSHGNSHRQNRMTPNSELPSLKAKREQALRNILAARRKQILGQRPEHARKSSETSSRDSTDVLEAQETRHEVFVEQPDLPLVEIETSSESILKTSDQKQVSLLSNDQIANDDPSWKLPNDRDSSSRPINEEDESASSSHSRTNYSTLLRNPPSTPTSNLLTSPTKSLKLGETEMRKKNTVSMPDSLYNHFRPVESNIPVEDMSQFLYFGQKIHRESGQNFSSNNNNSLEASTSLPSSSTSLSARRRYSMKRNGPGSTTSASVPRLEDMMNEEMNIAVERQTVEKNKISKIKNAFRSAGGGLYYRKSTRPSDSTIATNVILTREIGRNSTEIETRNETEPIDDKFGGVGGVDGDGSNEDGGGGNADGVAGTNSSAHASNTRERGSTTHVVLPGQTRNATDSTQIPYQQRPVSANANDVQAAGSTMKSEIRLADRPTNFRAQSQPVVGGTWATVCVEEDIQRNGSRSEPCDQSTTGLSADEDTKETDLSKFTTEARLSELELKDVEGEKSSMNSRASLNLYRSNGDNNKVEFRSRVEEEGTMESGRTAILKEEDEAKEIERKQIEEEANETPRRKIEESEPKNEEEKLKETGGKSSDERSRKEIGKRKMEDSSSILTTESSTLRIVVAEENSTSGFAIEANTRSERRNTVKPAADSTEERVRGVASGGLASPPPSFESSSSSSSSSVATTTTTMRTTTPVTNTPGPRPPVVVGPGIWASQRQQDHQQQHQHQPSQQQHVYAYTITNVTRLLRNYTGPGLSEDEGGSSKAGSIEKITFEVPQASSTLSTNSSLDSTLSSTSTTSSESPSLSPSSSPDSSSAFSSSNARLLPPRTGSSSIGAAQAPEEVSAGATVEPVTSAGVSPIVSLVGERHRKPVIAGQSQQRGHSRTTSHHATTVATANVNKGSTTGRSPRPAEVTTRGTVRWNETVFRNSDLEAFTDRRFLRKSASAVLNQRIASVSGVVGGVVEESLWKNRRVQVGGGANLRNGSVRTGKGSTAYLETREKEEKEVRKKVEEEPTVNAYQRSAGMNGSTVNGTDATTSISPATGNHEDESGEGSVDEEIAPRLGGLNNKVEGEVVGNGTFATPAPAIVATTIVSDRTSSNDMFLDGSKLNGNRAIKDEKDEPHSTSLPKEEEDGASLATSVDVERPTDPTTILSTITEANRETTEEITRSPLEAGAAPVFPVTPKILTTLPRANGVLANNETFTLGSAESVNQVTSSKTPEADRPFGIDADLDPSEIQKMYRSNAAASSGATTTLPPDVDENSSTRTNNERSPEVRARNLSDETKGDDILPIMHLYNTSDIFNGTNGSRELLARRGKPTILGEGSRPKVPLLKPTDVEVSKTTKSSKASSTSGARVPGVDSRVSSTPSSNVTRKEETVTAVPVNSTVRGTSISSTNRTRNRPAYHHSILPEYNDSVFPTEIDRTFLETGLISIGPRDSVNVSEVISKRHDGDAIASQETVAVVSYILATLVVFPIAVGVGLILRRLIIRNRKVLEESDTSSEISCRKDALNLENGDFKTSIEKAITKLPRIQHLCHEAEKPPPPASQESRWEFPRDKLRLQTVLGQGNFGQVWKAEADDLTGHQGTTRLVAVKTVKEGASEREKEDLVRELEIMQQLGSHPNVVTLLGCCTEEEPHYLILEYVMYGKLLAYLRDHRTRQDFYNFSEDSAALTSRDLTVFGYCVARGMEYLASKKIIHRDLAARNVLVDHNKLCKIADFGMSRFANKDGEVIETRHGRNALPIRWMAPESLIYSLFTTKTDVWSFGILMWEIVTLGSTPYPDMTAREVMRNVQSGYRLERPSHCRSELFRVISRCWHADPDRRPEFQTLRRDLAQLLEDNMNGHYVDLESFASECTD